MRVESTLLTELRREPATECLPTCLAGPVGDPAGPGAVEVRFSDSEASEASVSRVSASTSSSCRNTEDALDVAESLRE